jgi:hypothetical protein
MYVAAEDWKAKCRVCKEDVTFSNWKCSKLPGHHKVNEQTYFHLGGGHIQNARERRGWSPQVILRAGSEATDTRTGEKYLVPTIRVVFGAQQVTTEDPEIQFYLETKNDNSIAWGPEGRKSWDRIYLTPEQQGEIARKELDNLHKQIADQNSLLEQTKSRVGKGSTVNA